MTMYLQIEEQLQHMIYTKFLGYVPEGEEAELITNIDDSCLYYEFLHFMDEKNVFGGAGYGKHTEL